MTWFLTPELRRAFCMQMSTARAFFFLAATCWLLAPRSALSQYIALRSAPGVVVGVVSDTTGAPLEGADVVLAGKHRASTGPDGRFRFDSVVAGRLAIAARRLGFRPLTRVITVPDSGAIVLVSLVPLPNRLPPVVTSASRGGLSGVVADTAFKLLHGVEIYAVGSGKRASTDSAGEFYVDLKPGQYMVAVSRDGFATRTLSITVPRDSGRRVQIQLRGADRAMARRDANALKSLQARLIRRSAVWSKVFTAEDIEASGTKSIRQLAAFAAVARVDDSCPALLPAYADMERLEGSLAGSVPLWAIDPKDVEFMEVYATSGTQRYTQKSLRSGARMPSRPRNTSVTPACPQVIVWLKR